jgi:hypothetical protein
VKPARVTSGARNSETSIFLNALCAGKPDALHLLIWTLHDKASHWFQDAEGAIRFIASIAAHDVYVGVGFSPRDFGSSKRCVADEIAGIVGTWADIDIRSEAHPQTTLPATIEQALSILPPEFPPTFVIRTGNGTQAWWLFREPWIFENEDERRAAARFSYRWHSMLRDNASLRGYTYERLRDLARVLRVAGTMNCKDPSNPKPVVIQSQSEHRYNPSELTEYLDALGVADQEAEVRTPKNLAAPFRENPLKIDLSARIDEDRLKAWSDKDERFKVTWFRQRIDLRDQTRSGYDMALAHFGVKVGLSDQEIVDLIVHHRTVHRQAPRTQVGYYELTISKARETMTSNPDWAPEKAGNEPGEIAGPDASRIGPGKSDREKIQLCKHISAALGIEVLRMVKVAGDNPLYRMDLAAGSISFPGVDKLISKSAVRNAIAGKVGTLIPDLKPPVWRSLVQMMLDACIDEDGGEELESQGAARLSIRQYLSETTFIPGIADQLPQDQRKPMVRDDQIAVCASDFHLYLTRSQAISLSGVVAMLSAAGAKVERVRGKFKEQSRWMLPLDEFDPADYPSSMPGGSTEHA